MQKEKEPWYLDGRFPESDKKVEARKHKFEKIADKNGIKEKNKFAYVMGMLKKSYGK